MMVFTWCAFSAAFTVTEKKIVSQILVMPIQSKCLLKEKDMSENSISREGGAEKDKAGGVPKKDKDIIVNPRAIENYGSWMLVSHKNQRGDRRRDGLGFMSRMHDPRGTPMVTMIKKGPTSLNKIKDIASPSSFNVLELEEKSRGGVKSVGE